MHVIKGVLMKVLLVLFALALLTGCSTTEQIETEQKLPYTIRTVCHNHHEFIYSINGGALTDTGATCGWEYKEKPSV